MCGIAAVRGARDAGRIRRMMDRLAHRGPDEEGLWVAPREAAVLGHRRLSIMDPERGRQPIEGVATGRAAAANGEIYNHRELVGRFGLGDRLRSGSDSEVILRLYEAEGRTAFSRLEGMYAFVVADGDRFFAARDPIGIKPLYYGRREGATYLASELKALAGEVAPIREFPPGTLFDSARGFEPLGTLPDPPVEEEVPVEEWTLRIRTVLERAVRRRLMSDVPLGAFLSGGLDSSIIAAIVRRHVDRLHTFSVGVEGSPDLESARRVAGHLGTIHHEHAFDADDVRRALPTVIYHLESFDQDLVRSAVPTFFVARLAAERVKVILTGEGADELFAGYDYYKGIADAGSLSRELRRSVEALHNVNLQRVDRMTMAHGLEGRVPFLDLEVVDLARRIPAKLKLRPMDGRVVEKWILRKAYEDALPPEIVWRDKEQFDEGSGTSGLAGAIPPEAWGRTDAARYARAHSASALRSREEAFYHKLLCDAFEAPEGILENVARWADRPLHP